MDWEKDNNLETGLQFFWRSIKNFIALIGDYRRQLIVLVFMILVNQVLNLTGPYLYKLIIDELPNLIAQAQLPTKVILLLIAVVVVKIVGMFFWHYGLVVRYYRLAIHLENDWPVQAQQKLLSLSLGYHETENTGKKIAKIEKGIEKLMQILEQLYWNFIQQVTYILVNLVFIISIDWVLAIIYFVPIFPALLINAKLHKIGGPAWEEWEKKKETASGFFVQSLLNVKTVQNFVQEKWENGRLKKVRDDMKTLDVNVSLRVERLYFWISFVLNFGFILTILTSIYFVVIGRTSIGTVVFIIATGSVVIQNVWELMHSYAMISRKLYAVNRMSELLSEPIEIFDHPGAVAIPECEANIRFKNVSFAYPGKDEKVLADLSMQIQPRQMIALVGKSGEGKTTIIRLLCHMYDVAGGAIELAGIDIRKIRLEEYRRLFAIVQQDVDIFDGRLVDNVVYPYPESKREQIIEAIKAAHLDVILNDPRRFPDGLDTLVGERGVKLSGGERQRVGIARAYIAILNGAKVLVLDEATSNLDSEAERAIQTMINSVRAKLNISIVAIAHRLSTISQADVIYVINDGRVAESGDHERLKSRNGLYARLVELQKLGNLRE